MKKQKEITEAAEKIRREKWIKEKTQEIKEITVKGLEPDIQKLIAKHKAEIKKIKAMKQVFIWLPFISLPFWLQWSAFEHGRTR